MNKKGSFGLFFYVIILTALVVGFSVTHIENFDVNAFKTSLNWTDINITSLENSPDLGNALESLVNGMGEAVFSFIKWAAQWSYENPTLPFKLLIFLVFFAILSPILIFLFKFIIILFILIKEWIQNSKDKKEIKRLKDARGVTKK